MSNREIEELRARIIVLERLVIMLTGERYVDASKAGQDGLAKIVLDAKTWGGHFARAQFPGVDPAIADHRSAEVEQQAEQILSAVVDHVRTRQEMLSHRGI